MHPWQKKVLQSCAVLTKQSSFSCFLLLLSSYFGARASRTDCLLSGVRQGFNYLHQPDGRWSYSFFCTTCHEYFQTQFFRKRATKWRAALGDGSRCFAKFYHCQQHIVLRQFSRIAYPHWILTESLNFVFSMQTSCISLQCIGNLSLAACANIYLVHVHQKLQLWLPN